MAQPTTQRQRKANTFLKRGTDAMAALKQEQEKAEARREAAQNRGPMRFYVGKRPRGGFEEHELIFLDDDLTQAPFAYEHTIPGPNNNWSAARNHICIDEFDDCPLCRAAEQGLGDEYTPSKYGMYCTVLDLTPYTVKSGNRAGEVIPHTKKLYVVPHQQAQQILKMAELCKKMHGTTRGMVAVVTKTKDTDARCGIPQMLDNGMLFDFMTEDDLEEYANDEVRRDNKVVKPEGDDIEPFDYEQLLSPLDAKTLRKLYNLPAPPGSEDDEAEATGSTRRSRRSRRMDSAPEGDHEQGHDAEGDGTEEGQEQGEEGEAPPPATTRQRTRAAAPETPAPAASGRSRTRGTPEPEQPATGRIRRRSGTIPFGNE